MGIRLHIILLIIWMTSGCCAGGLYTNVIQPHTTNFHDTPIGTKMCILRDHRVQVNRVSAEWVTEHFANILKAAGITKVYYVDVKNFSILLGLYQRKTLIIYGD